MLKKSRVAIAILSILATTLFLVDFTGEAYMRLGWIAKLQLIPALLALSTVALAVIFLITIVFGRIYCSVICPLGIYQDIVIRLRSWIGPKKKRRNGDRYSPPHTAWRLSMLIIFIVLFVLGLTNIVAISLASLLEPYSQYSRIVCSLMVPVWDWGNNLLASSSADSGTYAFYYVWRASSWLAITVSVVTLAVVTVFAWRSGRGYCNSVCPVGTILGYLSKYSLFKPVIDSEKCRGCTKCSRNCKSACIDPKSHTIDYTRCVVCMNCLGMCHNGAISYRFAPGALRPAQEPRKEDTPDASRRSFITVTGIAGASLAVKAASGGMIPAPKRHIIQRETRPVPPGSMSSTNFTTRCIGCQVCVVSCPSSVLRPSIHLTDLMRPVMDFNKGFCRPECNSCSTVCPTGAITAIDLATKSSTQIGVAVVDRNLCLYASEGKICKACERNCPTGAIMLVDIIGSETEDGIPTRMMPAVVADMCIGCGSCEYHCPTGDERRPGKAIHVEGIDNHRLI